MAAAIETTEYKQRCAAQLLARGVPIGMVAQQVGTDRSTLYRWRHRSGTFQRFREQAKREVDEESRPALEQLALKTVAQLTPRQRARLGRRVLDAIVQSAADSENIHSIVQAEIENLLQNQRTAMTR